MLETDKRKYKNLTADLEWPRGSGIRHKRGDVVEMTIEQAAVYLTEGAVSECDDALPADIAASRQAQPIVKPVVSIEEEED